MGNFFALLAVLAFLFFGASCAPLQVLDTTYLKSGQLAGFYTDRDSKRPFTRYEAFPTDDNQYVKKWLSHFSAEGNGYENMRRYLERSSRYLDLMGDIFEEEGLPRDLVYMSMVESGFYPYAKSSMGAVGYWQFIRQTGLHYGLQINSYVDERQDFVLSTQAASRYLKDLYDTFGGWHLSMAAYNCGEQRVKNAIRRHGNNNFWYLVKRRALPSETINYVPKVIAMREIALNPQNYGFFQLNYREPLEYELVSYRGPSSLSHIAQYLKVPHGELQGLNSKLKTDVVPDEGQKKSYLRVPAHTRL